MTIIVGIKCENGVVIVCDGAASYATAEGTPTIKQPTKKLVILGDGLILGVSGAVSLHQCFQQEIEAYIVKYKGWKPRYFQSADELRKFANGQLFPHVRDAVDRAKATGAVIKSAPVDAFQHSILAFAPKAGDVCLAQIMPSCQVELASDDLPFIAVGSGQPAADPFLAFIRRLLWTDHKPSLSEGILAALWAVKHVIDVQPGMVAPPYQIMTLEISKGSLVATDKSDALAEHMEMIETIEKKIRESALDLFKGGPTDPMPEPPPRPAGTAKAPEAPAKP